MSTETAFLIFQDGSSFQGSQFGALKSASGEAVFNTGMVGYPQTLTDPSYFGQILVFTYPLIGNYGVPPHITKKGLSLYFESERIQPKGIVVADYSSEWNHWQSRQSLGEWLCDQGIPGITGVDTRAITQKLREGGSMLAKIIWKKDVPFYDPNAEQVLPEVSVKEQREYGKGDVKILLIDCGLKQNIIRLLVAKNVRVMQVPYNADISQYTFDGIVISNGPGDPKKCPETILQIKKAMLSNRPVFGICLGAQLMALSAQADTYKLKYGHRSQNQPCQDTETGQCYITSQNHGFSIVKKSLPKDWKVWFQNINDGSVEGIKHLSKPFFAVQFHPEASPGPTDTEFLFDQFIRVCKKSKKRSY